MGGVCACWSMGFRIDQHATLLFKANKNKGGTNFYASLIFSRAVLILV